jgi:hypothetical protein
MKLLIFNRLLLITVFTVIFPLALIAEEVAFDKPVRNNLAESLRPLFQDSIPAKKKPETKPEKRDEKPPRDINDERLKEVVGRAIKQVPRSIPKLKPRSVTERIKIRRQ